MSLNVRFQEPLVNYNLVHFIKLNILTKKRYQGSNEVS